MTPSVRQGLAVAALLLAGGAAAVGESRWPGETPIGAVGPLELAAWIREGRPGLRIVDLRGPEAHRALRVPLAQNVAPDALDTLPVRPGPLVVYGSGPEAAVRASLALRAAGHPDVRPLVGGIVGWATEVFWPTLGPDAGPDEEARFRVAREHARYFGGEARRLAPGQPAAGTDVVETLLEEARRSGCGW